jgi:acyl-CoA:acyl-CoA alkyltransferase
MTANAVYRHQRAGILSVSAVDAPEVITSVWIDEQLQATYDRNGLRPGLLAELAGIHARRWWPADVRFDDAAAQAGEVAIQQAGIDRAQIGMLISTSVCKHHLEPSVACVVHDRLGLPTSCVNFDLANACLGFVNAMHLAATSIDAGHVDYVLIVDGEGSRQTQLATIGRLQNETSTAVDVFDEFASLTLGSGAAAMVMGNMDKHPDAHRFVGGIALLEAGLDLAEAAWKTAGEDWDWQEGMDWYIVHQVSSVHTNLMCQRLGIDPVRVPLTYPQFGNVWPAAIPITLAKQVNHITPGQRVLCMGIGSGLNTSFTEIVW